MPLNNRQKMKTHAWWQVSWAVTQLILSITGLCYGYREHNPSGGFFPVQALTFYALPVYQHRLNGLRRRFDETDQNKEESGWFVQTSHRHPSHAVNGAYG